VVPAASPPIELPARPAGSIERAIAEHVARLIPDQATVELGLGAIPETVTHALGGKRGLGVHSGTIGDGIADLMEAGIVDNRHKEIDTGTTVATMLMGTRRLYRFAGRNPSIHIRATSYTHDALVLGNFRRFVAINGALEVDLTGQVNAETAAGTTYRSGRRADGFRARRQSRARWAIDHRAAIDQPRPHPLAHRRQARGRRCQHPARRG